MKLKKINNKKFILALILIAFIISAIAFVIHLSSSYNSNNSNSFNSLNPNGNVQLTILPSNVQGDETNGIQ